MKKHRVSNPKLNPLRFRRLGDVFLLTNDWGGFAFVSEDVFSRLVSGKLDSSHPKDQELIDGGFSLEQGDRLHEAAVYRQRNEHLFIGPLLHIFVVTLRCDHTCVYCQAGRRPIQDTQYDMSEETASAALDIAFRSPSPSLTLEFQGGEPLAHFERVRQIVEGAKKRARETEKDLYFTLVTNLALMDEDKLHYLVDNGVQICTSLDGPKDLHDKNRKGPGESRYETTVRWMDRINEIYAKRGLDPDLAHVGALLTVTRESLHRSRDLIDEYVARGLKVIHLRPLQPFGFAEKAWRAQSYSPEEYLRFYEEALDHILDLNRKGVEILEKTASLFATRIFTQRNVNYMDLRSPCGAGIGQLAYNYDGRVYTCDEGRMVGAMGDDLFCIGEVSSSSFTDIVRHEGVRSVCVASCLEGIPECSECAYLPYCGVCPVFTYVTQGGLFPRTPTCERCQIQKGILDLLFERLRDGGSEVERLLKRWTIERDRSSVYRSRT